MASQAAGDLEPVPMSGALVCKCQDGYLKGAVGFLQVRSVKFNYTSVDGVTQHKNVEICKPYADDSLKAFALNNWIKYLIIILNTVIRMAVIKIITYMGCSTETS